MTLRTRNACIVCWLQLAPRMVLGSKEEFTSHCHLVASWHLHANRSSEMVCLLFDAMCIVLLRCIAGSNSWPAAGCNVAVSCLFCSSTVRRVCYTATDNKRCRSYS